MAVVRNSPHAVGPGAAATFNAATNSGSGLWLFVPPSATLLIAFICGFSSGTDSYLDSGNYSFTLQGQSFTHLMRSPQISNSFDMAVCYLTSPNITAPDGIEVPFTYNISSSMSDGYMIYVIAFSDTDTAAPFASSNIIEAPSGLFGEVSGVSGTINEDYLLMATLDSTGAGFTEGSVIETAGPSAKAGGMYLRVRGEVWGPSTSPFYSTNLGANASLAALSLKYKPGQHIAWLTA